MYCPNCMGIISSGYGGTQCPYCHESLQTVNNSNQLQVGTVLSDRYLIGKAIGQGGFGITYIGIDKKLDSKVAIKEYYPGEIATRITEYSKSISISVDKNRELFIYHRQNFIDEARILASFVRNPNIVKVQDIFEENNTAYIVMEYLAGTTLDEYLKKNGVLSFNRILAIITPIMQALKEVHKAGLIHRDISPSNIMLVGTQPVLLDFGAARFSTEYNNKSMSIIVKPRYAPVEQYDRHGMQGSWSDVYSLCATIYKMLTNVTPENSLERIARQDLRRPSELGATISPEQEAVLLLGMAVWPEDRIRTIDELEIRFQEASAEGITQKDEETVSVSNTIKATQNTNSFRDQENNTGTIIANDDSFQESSVDGTTQRDGETVSVNNTIKSAQSIKLYGDHENHNETIIANDDSFQEASADGTTQKDEETVSVNNTIKATQSVNSFGDQENHNGTIIANDESFQEASADGTVQKDEETVSANNTIKATQNTNTLRDQRKTNRKTIQDDDNSASYIPTQNIKSGDDKGKSHNKPLRIIGLLVVATTAIIGIWVNVSGSQVARFINGDQAVSEITVSHDIEQHTTEEKGSVLAEIAEKQVDAVEQSHVTLSDNKQNEKSVDQEASEEAISENEISEVYEASEGSISDDEPEDDPTDEPMDDFVIDWKDTALESKMREITGISSRKIMYSDVINITVLNLSNDHDASDDIKIKDISALSNLKHLTILSLSNNQISDISSLSDLSGLYMLNLYKNQVNDISPLSKLNNIRNLSLGDNQINDISPLRDLRTLDVLELINNQISDISALSGLTNLTDLYLDGNQIRDISPLKGLSKLMTLYLSNNQINDISALSGLHNLKKLTLQHNQIVDYSPLNELASISQSETSMTDEQLEDFVIDWKDPVLEGKMRDITGIYSRRIKYSDVNQITELDLYTGYPQDDKRIKDISALSNFSSLAKLVSAHKSRND